MKKAVIILPTYNEEGNIVSLIEAILYETRKIANWKILILVVDSKSTDNTANLVKNLIKKYPKELHFLQTEKDGLGKAYTDGFRYALKQLNPFVIFEMDADWSHNPLDIPLFLRQIEKGADFVYGSRYIKGGSIPDAWDIHRKIFSIFGNLIIRLGFMKLKITDWTNGFRAIKSWVIKDLLDELKNYSGYVFQIAFLDKALKKGVYVMEVPNKFHDREKGYSKINFSQYIFQILIYIFVNSSFIKFVIVGLIGFIIDFGIAYLLIEKIHIKKYLFGAANGLSSEIAIISNFILNNFWSFSHKKINSKNRDYFPKFLQFNLISSGSIIIQWIGVQLMTNIIGSRSWYLYKIGIITFIIIPYSYILYNKFIWKDKK